MLKIIVREATDDEKLNVGGEDLVGEEWQKAETPEGIISFDGGDWEWEFLESLVEGDYVIEIEDPTGILNSQKTGTFYVQKADCGGYVKVA